MCIKIIKIRLPCVNTDPQAPLNCRSTMSDESRWVLRVFRPTLNDPFYQPCQRALSHGIRILGGYLRAFHIEVSDPLDRSIYTTEPRFDLDACWRASNSVNLQESVKILGVRHPNLTAMDEMGWATYARICDPCCDGLIAHLDSMEPDTDIPTPAALHSSASPSDGSPESSYSASGLTGDYTPGYSQAGGHPGDMSMLGAFPSEPPLYLRRDPFESPDEDFALSAAESEDSNSPPLDDGDTNMAQNGTRSSTRRGPNLAHPQPSSSHVMNASRPLVDRLTNSVNTQPPSSHYTNGNTRFAHVNSWLPGAAQAQINGNVNHNGTNGHTPGRRIPPWRLVNGNDHLNVEPPTHPSPSNLTSEDRHRNAFPARQPFGPGESHSAAVANNVRGFAQNVPLPEIAVSGGQNGSTVLAGLEHIPPNELAMMRSTVSHLPQNEADAFLRWIVSDESSEVLRRWESRAIAAGELSIEVRRANRGRGSTASSTRGSTASGTRGSTANRARGSRANGARSSRANGVRGSTASGSARGSTANGVQGSMANGVRTSTTDGVPGSMGHDARGGSSAVAQNARGNRGRSPGLLVFPNNHPGLPFDQPDSPRSQMWWDSAHPRNEDLSGYTSSPPFNGSGPATSSDQEQSEPRTPSEPTGRRSSFLNVVLSNGHRHPSQSSGEGDEEEKID